VKLYAVSECGGVQYKGSNSYEYSGIPQDKPWGIGQTKDNPSPDTTSTPLVTTIA
jgi:hypothetical protein